MNINKEENIQEEIIDTEDSQEALIEAIVTSKMREIRTYKKNVPFYASLTCTGVGRGTSACRFHWEDEISDYTMFPTDVRELLLMNVATNPLTGYFAIVKKGANFGIKYLGKVNPNGEN